MKFETFEKRFWARVVQSETCWFLPGGNSPKRYRQVMWRGRRVGAHRVAYELAHGPIPEGLFVLHSCDSPPCCNPAHLHCGTQRENIGEARERGRLPKGDTYTPRSLDGKMPRGADHWSHRMPERVLRGDRAPSSLHPERLPRGEAHPGAKLTSDQVVSIRTRYAAGGISQQALANEYGVARGVVSRILHRKAWKHL